MIGRVFAQRDESFSVQCLTRFTRVDSRVSTFDESEYSFSIVSTVIKMR